MKFNLTFILLLFFLLSCRENSSLHINSLVAYEPMSFQLEELILYQKFCHDSIVSSNERFGRKSIDGYLACINEEKLTLELVFGFMSGETFTIELFKDTFTTSNRSWGCTIHESYDYITRHQSLILNHSSLSTDTLIGYIEYVGEMDWEGYKNRMGIDEKDAQKESPCEVQIKGKFKVKLYPFCDDEKFSYALSYKYLERLEKWQSIRTSGHLDTMKYLSLSYMELIKLPDELQSMHSLKIIALEVNHLQTEALNDLKDLSSLESIYLGSNDLTSFPDILLSMPNLKELSLANNPISNLPISQLLKSGILRLDLIETNISEDQIRMIDDRISVKLIHGEYPPLRK